MNHNKFDNSKVNAKALKSFPSFWIIVSRDIFYACFACLLFSIIMFIEGGFTFKHMTVAPSIALFLIPIVSIYWTWEGFLKEHTKVRIYADKIIIKRTFGRRKQEFHIRELNNYRTDIMLGARGIRHKYLYIIKDDMEIVIISELNHWNYRRMKDEIDKNLAAAQEEATSNRKNRKIKNRQKYD